MAPTLEVAAQPVSSLLWLYPLFSIVPAWTIEYMQEACSRAPVSHHIIGFQRFRKQKKGILEKPLYELSCSPLIARPSLLPMGPWDVLATTMQWFSVVPILPHGFLGNPSTFFFFFPGAQEHWTLEVFFSAVCDARC